MVKPAKNATKVTIVPSQGKRASIEMRFKVEYSPAATERVFGAIGRLMADLMTRRQASEFLNLLEAAKNKALRDAARKPKK